MKITTDRNTLILVGVGILTVLYVKGKAEKAAADVVDAVGDAVGDIGQAVNPVSNENIFYKGANSVFHALGGNKNDTIGTWFYEVLN